MIILSATTESLQVLLAGNITTSQLQCNASYVTTTSTTYTPGGNSVLTVNPPSTATLVSAPGGASTYVQIKNITINNTDTVQATVIIQKDVSGTPKIIVKAVLEVNESLIYSDSEGFTVSTLAGESKTFSSPTMVISAGTNSVSSGTISFADSNGILFGLSGSSRLTASLSKDVQSFWEPPWAELNANGVNTISGSQNLSLQRFFLPYYMTVTRLDFLGHLTVAGSTAGSWNLSAVIYTRGGASTLSSASSTQSGVSWGSSGATSNTDSYAGLSGTRWRSLAPSSWAFTPGEYWLGVMMSVVGAGATTGSVTLYGQSSVPIMAMPGGNNDVVGHMGIFSAGTASPPTAIIITSDIIYATTGIATQSWAMRQPYFRMFGTF